jgi:AcrR family transcriptional regulator
MGHRDGGVMTDNTKRTVGRPRHFDDASERRMILDAAYRVMRDKPSDLTIASVLTAAGVSTRSLYRHFDSKDALVREMYMRDARWAAARLTKRLADAASPTQAVEWWIDEIYSFTREHRRAERVSVLSSITGSRAEGVESVAGEARRMLIAPLHAAIDAGVTAGVFDVDDIGAAAELVSAATMHAAGLSVPYRVGTTLPQPTTTAFCLAALRHTQ